MPSLLFSSVAWLALSPALAALQARRLNEALPLGPTAGSVSEFQLTPDEGQVLYLADPDVEGRVELLSVALGGPVQPEPLSDPQLDEVTGFSLGQAGERVVYVGRRNLTYGLFSTRLDGSSGSTRLTSALPTRVQVDPTGTRVAFTTRIDGAWELRTLPVDRPSPERTIARSAERDFDFLFLPDGSRLVYLQDLDLFSVPSDAGAAPIALSPPGYVTSWRLTADGSRAVYRLQYGLQTQLWSVPSDGSTSPVQLEVPVSGRNVTAFDVGADGSRVAFLQDREVALRQDLFVVPIAGGASTRLYTPLDATDSVASPRFTPDGSRVTFRLGPSSAGTSAILSAPADGGAAPLVLVQVDGLLSTYQLTPDGSRLVHVRRASATAVPELRSVPTDGSAAPTLLDASVSGTFRLSPAGERALYYRHGTNDLYSVATAGGAAPDRLNAELPPGAGVWFDFQVSTAGRVLFRADQETAGVVELFEVPLDASISPRKLNAALAPSVIGDVHAFQATDETAVFAADQERDDVIELYRVELDRPGRVTRLGPPLAGDRDVAFDFVLSPGGDWVIYRSDEEENDQLELFALRADGRSDPVRLSGPMPAFSDVVGVQLAPDGGRVVFQADREVDGLLELYSVDTSAVPLHLNAPLVPGRHVWEYRISPDSRHVVYRGDLLTDGVPELFSAPIDAEGGQVRLHGPPPAEGGVLAFRFSPDGTRVAFSGSLVTLQTELYTAPVDGSGPVIPLLQGATTRNVRALDYTADGARVVFEVGQSQNTSLYSVPADGSAVPVWLAAGRELAFVLPPSGPWVVFGTDAGLSAVRADGSQGAVLLSPAVSGERFAVTPDGTRVVFASSSGVSVVPIDGSAPARLLDARGSLADDFAFGPEERTLLYRSISLLLAVPLDGSRPASIVGSIPVNGGEVGKFQALSGGRVVFGGDLEVNGVNELWLGLPGGAPHAARR